MVKTVQTKQRSESMAPGDGIVRDEILYLPLASIDPDPDQPRLVVDDELADSIEQHGVLQAIQVRPHPRDADRWQIIDGERRWTGAKRAHLPTIPATISLDVEDVADRIVRQLVRNEGKPLTPVEEALAFKKIIDARHAAGDKKYGVVQLAREVGVAKSTISDRLTLTEIPNFWLDLIVRGPLQTSHAPILHRWRKVPEKYQRIALEQMRKDYRWPGVQPGHKAKGEDRLYVGDFETLVRQYFPKFAKPVSDVPGYSGPTESLTLDGYTGRKVYAMDPSQWGPIWRKGIAARRAKEAKKNKSASSSGGGGYDYAAEEWAEGLPAIFAQTTSAIAALPLEKLGNLVLDFLNVEDESVKLADQHMPRGDFPTATALLQHALFAHVADEIEGSYGKYQWPRIAKQLGVTAAKAEKKKRVKKARAAAPEAVAPFDDAGGVLVDVGEYAKPAPAGEFELVDEGVEAEA